MQVNERFQPTIVAFCCNWCSYFCHYRNRLYLPPTGFLIRLM